MSTNGARTLWGLIGSILDRHGIAVAVLIFGALIYIGYLPSPITDTAARTALLLAAIEAQSHNREPLVVALNAHILDSKADSTAILAMLRTLVGAVEDGTRSQEHGQYQICLGLADAEREKERCGMILRDERK